MMTTAYERVADRILKQNRNEQRRPVVYFLNGRVLTGTKSLHRTRAACVWRKFWRMKKVHLTA